MFSEHGYAGDPIYPLNYSAGNASQPNTGCDNPEYKFCPLAKPYNRQGPTKQNLLCAGKSALEVITDVIELELTNSLSSKENKKPTPAAKTESHEKSTHTAP